MYYDPKNSSKFDMLDIRDIRLRTLSCLLTVVYENICGRIQLLKNTIAIALNTLPDIMTIIKFLKLYLFAPAIIGMISPTIGIHGEKNMISQPYLSSKAPVLSSCLLWGFL